MANWTPTQIKVILELADEAGYSHIELAKRLDIDRAHMSKVLSALEKEHLIRKEGPRKQVNPKTGQDDKRRTVHPYYLTDKIDTMSPFLFFQPEELEYPYTYASVFSNAETPLTSCLKDKYSVDAKQLLVKFKETHILSKSDKLALVNELNRLIKCEDLFDCRLFQGIILRKRTEKLIRHLPDGVERLLLNRLLIEDAFPYCLRKRATVQVFSNFIEELMKQEMYSELKNFLGSNYINNRIEKDGFFSLYRIIEPHLNHHKFRKAASSLLSLSATQEQFKKIFELEKILTVEQFSQSACDYFSIKLPNTSKIEYCDFFPQFRLDLVSNSDENLSSVIQLEQKGVNMDQNINFLPRWMGEMMCNTTPWKNMRSEVLSKFDPLSAVVFCRDNISKILIGLYEELVEKNLITSGMKMFLECDSHLSPLTSYPFNDYENLLFFPPFKRLYEDVYILDKKDYDIFIRRAQVIYDNFADLLLDRQRSMMRYALNEQGAPCYNVGSQEYLKADWI
jgi:hypothetical protein